MRTSDRIRLTAALSASVVAIWWFVLTDRLLAAAGIALVSAAGVFLAGRRR